VNAVTTPQLATCEAGFNVGPGGDGRRVVALRWMPPHAGRCAPELVERGIHARARLRAAQHP
jgi:hypothetical protein